MVKHSLKEFESIGDYYGQILQKSMKIRTVDDFLKFPAGEIHLKCNIDLERVEQWRDLIDLFRVPNLGARECELLYNSNVNSVSELSHRQSLRIFYKLREIDAETRFIVLQFPKFAEIDEWIYFAKLMTKRIKYGLNIPLILFPMVNIDIASEFKKFSIFTAEDLWDKRGQIKNLAKKVGMRRKNYHGLLHMVEVVNIPGIDIYFANILKKGGFETVEKLRRATEQEILERVGLVQKEEGESLETFPSALCGNLKRFLTENLEATS